MKVQSTNPNTTRRYLAGPLTLLTATLLLCATTQRSFGNGADIFPINSKPYGKTYGQWTVAYWQWAMGIPFAQNPWANDPTGQFASVGQSGPVWFLGGSLGDSADRTLTVPSSKAIFLPVHQWIFGATVGDCDPSNPGVTCDVPTLQDSAAAATTAATAVEASIDGHPVANVHNYRALSPGGFSVNLPVGNVPQALGLSTPAGTYSPQVSDGYWLLLAPLESGRHTLRVHVVNGSEYVVTYHILVRD